MHKPHPPPPRPSTAAPGRRNLTSVAVTVPVTAAPPPVTAAATTSVTAPVMVRFKKSDLIPYRTIGLDAISRLNGKERKQPMWLSEQPSPKQLSIINDGDISPPPRLREMEEEFRRRQAEVRTRMAENRANRENDRANYLIILNKQPLIPVPPSGRPAKSRSNRHGLRVPTSNSGSLDLPNEGGRTRARKIGRKGRKGTNKRRRYIVAKTRRQRRGNN